MRDPRRDPQPGAGKQASSCSLPVPWWPGVLRVRAPGSLSGCRRGRGGLPGWFGLWWPAAGVPGAVGAAGGAGGWPPGLRVSRPGKDAAGLGGRRNALSFRVWHGG